MRNQDMWKVASEHTLEGACRGYLYETLRMVRFARVRTARARIGSRGEFESVAVWPIDGGDQYEARISLESRETLVVIALLVDDGGNAEEFFRTTLSTTRSGQMDIAKTIAKAIDDHGG